MSKQSIIAVDVTPIVPGGENGGAKVLIFELISGLAQAAPSIQFVLFTQAASHDELACLDRENVRRMSVIGSSNSPGNPTLLQATYQKLLVGIPAFIRLRLAQMTYAANSFLKRAGRSDVLKQLDADLLFCPFTAPTFHDRRIPTVCLVHDIQFASYPQFFEPEDLANRKSAFLDACRKATVLVAVSDYTREAAINYANLAPSNIRTVASRIAKRMQPPAKGTDNVLAQHGLLSGRFLLYPANFWRHKNHEMLLTAFGMACANGLPEDFKLVLTGAPGERQKFIQNAAATFGLADRVILPGYVSTVELSELLNHAGGVVFPSLYEGFGLPVIEAMSAGVPVACSNLTALPEVAGDGALLFDPKKPHDISRAIVDLVTDDGLRKRLIESGRMRASPFADTGRMVAEYLQVFKDATNGRVAVTPVDG